MIRLATYLIAVVIGYAIVGHLDYETKHAEDKERVALMCKRLGRTVAEDTSGRFTCMDLVPAWAMTHPLRYAQIRETK